MAGIDVAGAGECGARAARTRRGCGPVGRGTAAAKDIRLSERRIGARLAPGPAVPAGPGASRKNLLRTGP
jgi:hypothetical protein